MTNNINGDNNGKGDGATDDDGNNISGVNDNGDIQRVTTTTMMAMDDDDSDGVTDGR